MRSTVPHLDPDRETDETRETHYFWEAPACCRHGPMRRTPWPRTQKP